MTEELGRGQILSDAMVGWPVCTKDGEEIGHVKEIRGPYFKVDARMQTDYWLQLEFVQSAADDRVVMEIAKDDLGDYKVEEPNFETGQPTPMTHATPEGGLPENAAAAEIRNVTGRPD